jgi:drug/metabolite transporter (DMT)-like permease
LRHRPLANRISLPAHVGGGRRARCARRRSYYRWIGAAYPPLELNGWQNLFGAFLLLPFAADFDIMMKSLTDGIFAIALAHLTITVSIGTMLLWFYIIRLIGASQASAFHFLVPIFGIIQSAIILNDRITTPDVLGIFVVSVSLMLVNGSSTNRSKKYSTGSENSPASYRGRG